MGQIRIIILLSILALCGCSASSKTSATYDPSTFRADITRLIDARQYRQAVSLVKSADVDRQVAADRNGYMAIGGYSVLLPGLDAKMQYDGTRDWYVPGTSDVIENAEWQSVATDFAKRYNARRRGMSGQPAAGAARAGG